MGVGGGGLGRRLIRSIETDSVMICILIWMACNRCGCLECINVRYAYHAHASKMQSPTLKSIQNLSACNRLIPQPNAPRLRFNKCNDVFESLY